MKGDLFRFGGGLIGFLSGNDHTNVIVFIGGLGDTLLALPYVEKLDIEGWSVCQCILSSAGIGYGTSSIQTDVVELDLLLTTLAKEYETENVILLGHSTGCQDAVAFLKANTLNKDMVKKIILQGPVSDRDYMVLLPDTAERLEYARNCMTEGREDALLPLTPDDRTPMTAKRYVSLVERLGEDDMFSMDLTSDEMNDALGHISIPCMISFSMNDEFVPEGTHATVSLKLHQAISHSTLKLYGGAGHGLGDVKEVERFVEDVRKFVL